MISGRPAINPRGGPRGFTLLELLTVIIILSLLMGMAVYFLRSAHRDLGVDAAANLVAGQLRAAHQLARSESSPAWVVLNLKENSASTLLRETVGEWHFEEASPTLGAFGRDCQITGATAVPARVGHGMRMTPSSVIRCGEVPVYSPEQGLAIELWFLRKGAKKGTLCTVGSQVELWVQADGSFTGRVGAIPVSSGNARIPTDAWCHVQLISTGRDVRLVLNRNPVAVQPGKAQWVEPPLPFTVGHAQTGPQGILDEVRLSLIVPRDTLALPADCAFELMLPPPPNPLPPEFVIAFDDEGRLEGFTEVKFAVKSAANRREISVGVAGNVQGTQPPPPAPAPSATPTGSTPPK